MHAFAVCKDEADLAIGRALRNIRKSKRLLQKDLAARIGVSQSIVSSVESGKRSLYLDEAIVYAFGLDMTPRSLLDELGAILEENGFLKSMPSARPAAPASHETPREPALSLPQTNRL